MWRFQLQGWDTATNYKERGYGYKGNEHRGSGVYMKATGM